MYSLTLTPMLRNTLSRYSMKMSHDIIQEIMQDRRLNDCSDTLTEAKIISKCLTNHVNKKLRALQCEKSTEDRLRIDAKSMLVYVTVPKAQCAVNDTWVQNWLDDIIRHYIPFTYKLYYLE